MVEVKYIFAIDGELPYFVSCHRSFVVCIYKCISMCTNIFCHWFHLQMLYLCILYWIKFHRTSVCLLLSICHCVHIWSFSLILTAEWISSQCIFQKIFHDFAHCLWAEIGLKLTLNWCYSKCVMHYIIIILNRIDITLYKNHIILILLNYIFIII